MCITERKYVKEMGIKIKEKSTGHEGKEGSRGIAVLFL
jgi:hypothetical protein